MKAPATSLRRRALHLVLALALLAPTPMFASMAAPAGMQGDHEMSEPHGCCPPDEVEAMACAAFCAAAASATLPSAAPAIARVVATGSRHDAPTHAPPTLSAPPLLRPPDR